MYNSVYDIIIIINWRACRPERAAVAAFAGRPPGTDVPAQTIVFLLFFLIINVFPVLYSHHIIIVLYFSDTRRGD